jgi:hypothetical protein
MAILFVTGSDSAFFNSSLICLQSFSERLPDQQLFVCDFGMTAVQAEFLQSLGQLLPRPPELAGCGTFYCKAAVGRYLHHSGRRIADYDAVVWLDADLMLMQVGLADFVAVAAAMTSAAAAVAICAEPTGRTIGQMIAMFPGGSKMAPFARAAAAAAIDADLPYFSTGVIFCRSAAVLERWAELTLAAADHPLVEQNMFNVALRSSAVTHLTLPCEDWQAQGQSLDNVRLAPAADGGRLAAHIRGTNIKTLHTTSPAAEHLLIGFCRLTVHNFELAGSFKLFMDEPLRMAQLQLLASFLLAHRQALLRLGICTPAAAPAEGFQFVTR